MSRTPVCSFDWHSELVHSCWNHAAHGKLLVDSVLRSITSNFEAVDFWTISTYIRYKYCDRFPDAKLDNLEMPNSLAQRCRTRTPPQLMMRYFILRILLRMQAFVVIYRSSITLIYFDYISYSSVSK